MHRHNSRYNPRMKLLWKTPSSLFALVFVLVVSATLCPPAHTTAPGGSAQTTPAPASPNRISLSSGIAAANLTHKITPAYPAYAKANRIQGAVVLQTVIDKQGRVAEVKTLSGHRYLAPAAVDAVRQWRYRPYLLNGNPVEVETTVTVNFNLTDTARQVVVPESLVH